MRETGGQLMLGYTHQCSTIAQRLRRRIASGTLGPLVHVSGLSANCLRPLLEGRSGAAVFGDGARRREPRPTPTRPGAAARPTARPRTASG